MWLVTVFVKGGKMIIELGGSKYIFLKILNVLGID